MQEMRYRFSEFIIRFLLLMLLGLLLCSCKKIRKNSLLLQGKEYKLWYIVESGNEKPEFFYIDCYGKFRTLGVNPKTGYFFLINDDYSSFPVSGKWKYDSDSSILLNNIIYSIQEDTYNIRHEFADYTEQGLETSFSNEDIQIFFLYNNIINDTVILRDTNIPIDLISYGRGKEEDIEHYEKWRKEIKKSPLLKNKDYKLWHLGNVESLYYLYYDKYGQMSYISLDDKYWQFKDANIFTGRWYQNKNIIYQLIDSEYKVFNANSKPDTLKLYNLKGKHDWILIDPNLPPTK